MWPWMDQQMVWEEVTAKTLVSSGSCCGALAELLPCCPGHRHPGCGEQENLTTTQQGKGELPAKETTAVVQCGDFEQTVLGQVFPQGSSWELLKLWKGAKQSFWVSKVTHSGL